MANKHNASRKHNQVYPQYRTVLNAEIAASQKIPNACSACTRMKDYPLELASLVDMLSTYLLADLLVRYIIPPYYI